jgi:effector-binding domain-containing protein
VAGDGRVIAGVLPAGRYVIMRHVGHPDELMAATGSLLDWAAEQGLTWDVSPSPAGDRWGARLEIYHSDPDVEPDMTKWETELVFRLAD